MNTEILQRLDGYRQSTNPFTRIAVADAAVYNREQKITDIVPLWPEERDDYSADGRLHVIERLARALDLLEDHRANGCWYYNICHHQAVISAYVAECTAYLEQNK